jgi:hypothetical protein
MECPKCGAVSGEDWSQCESVCPMAASPHFDPDWEKELTDEEYLMDLAERLRSVPAVHGVDQYDCDRLRWIAQSLKERES